MTVQKMRATDTVEDGLVTIMGELSVKVCAEIVGKSTSWIYQASDPDNDTVILNVKQARALDAAYVKATNNHAPIASAYRREISEIVAPQHEPGNRTDRIASFAKESGEGLAAYTLLGDETISRTDGMHAIKEIDEMVEVGQLMKRDIIARMPGET
jgi:hypothetical protein